MASQCATRSRCAAARRRASSPSRSIPRSARCGCSCTPRHPAVSARAHHHGAWLYRPWPLRGLRTKAQVPVVTDLDPLDERRGRATVRAQHRTARRLAGGDGRARVADFARDLPRGQGGPAIDPAITFFAGKHRSILQMSDTTLDRAAAFTDAVPGWLMWPLALLFFVGTPLAAAALLLVSARRS